MTKPRYAALALALITVASSAAHGQSGNLKKVEFDQASLEEVIGFFRAAPGAGAAPRNVLIDPKLDKNVTVSLTLHDVSRGVAFAYAAEIAGFDYRDEKHALRIFPAKSGSPVVKPFLKRGGAVTARRAAAIRLPKVDFESTELAEAISDLATASRQLDPKKKGLNIILSRGVDPSTPVTLKLRDVPVSTVLNYVAEFARLKLRADGAAIVMMPRARN